VLPAQRGAVLALDTHPRRNWPGGARHSGAPRSVLSIILLLLSLSFCVPFIFLFVGDSEKAQNDQVAGVLNAVAPDTVTNAQFAKTLGKEMHRPALVPLPGEPTHTHGMHQQKEEKAVCYSFSTLNV